MAQQLNGGMPDEYRASLCTGVYGGYSIKNESPISYAYGGWTSPLTSSSIAGSSMRISYISINESKVYWQESRPNEKGRNVITTLNNSDKMDITPKDLSSSSRVHEYGGCPYIILKDGSFLTSNAEDGKIYHITKNEYKPITNEHDSVTWRYADFCQNLSKPNYIYAVREQHMAKDDKPSDVVNCLVRIDMESCIQTIVASGNAFYSYPRADPNGKYLAYITWNHPNMPWDNTMLFIATLNERGEITSQTLIDSGSSMIQPLWSSDGKSLFYITDQRDWWEIWRYDVLAKQSRPVLNGVVKYEFGWPCWNIGKQRFDLLDDDTLYAAAIQNGTSKLIKISNIRDKDVESKMEIIDLNAQQISHIEELVIDKKKQKIYLLAGGPLCSSSIFEYDVEDDKKENIVPKVLMSSGKTVDPKYISIPESIVFKTTNNQNAYAYVYKPKNDDIKMDEKDESKPPLLVLNHGGPTASCNSVYNESILFFTSRGFMVANVNYRGSTGYGTMYRDLLKGNWGVYDKDDCCACAEYLKSKGLVNPNQIAIRGGSAGGYTTLCCLTFDEKKTFTIGCSRYGVADIGLLLRDTHKFESEYVYPLIGDDEKLFHDRSPINFVDRLKCPVLFEQGDMDRVVPLNQSQSMFDAMVKNKVTASLEIFEGEGHGFRQADSKIRAMDYEYTFYAELLGFSLSTQDQKNMKKPKIVYGDK